MASDTSPTRRQNSSGVTYRTAQERRIENQRKDMALPWRRWLRERYARYWYGLGAFLLDLVVAGTIIQLGSGNAPAAAQIAAAIVLLVVLSYLELLGFRRLWPPPPAD